MLIFFNKLKTEVCIQYCYKQKTIRDVYSFISIMNSWIFISYLFTNYTVDHILYQLKYTCILSVPSHNVMLFLKLIHCYYDTESVAYTESVTTSFFSICLFVTSLLYVFNFFTSLTVFTLSCVFFRLSLSVEF